MLIWPKIYATATMNTFMSHSCQRPPLIWPQFLGKSNKVIQYAYSPSNKATWFPTINRGHIGEIAFGKRNKYIGSNSSKDLSPYQREWPLFRVATKRLTTVHMVHAFLHPASLLSTDKGKKSFLTLVLLPLSPLYMCTVLHADLCVDFMTVRPYNSRKIM